MLLKDISCLELWQPLCTVEWNHLCNLGKRCHEEEFCETILNQWVSRCLLNIFLNWSSGRPFVQWSGTINAILVKGIMRDNSVKLFEFGQVVQEEMSLKDISYLEL